MVASSTCRSPVSVATGSLKPPPSRVRVVRLPVATETGDLQVEDAVTLQNVADRGGWVMVCGRGKKLPRVDAFLSPDGEAQRVRIIATLF